MRWWSVANFVSNAGTWMQLTVQNLLVLEITGSAAATGLSMSVQAAPALLISVLGGAAVDRWPRKLTAAVSQAVLGAIAFTTAVLVALDRIDMTSLMVLAAVTGVVATVDNPACALLGNDLVPAEDVPSAIGVGALVHQAGRLVGAALAGVAVGFLGTSVAYFGNGLSFLFVASVIPFLRPAAGAARAQERNHRASKNTGPDLTVREGLAYFVRRPRLVALAGVTGISSVFGRNYGLTLAVLVTGPLAGGAGSFGTVSTVLAVGGILGAVLGARLRRPSVRLVGALAAAGGLLQAMAGVSPSLAVLIALVLPMAVVESISDTAGTAVLQTDPPAHLRGRVLGVWGSIGTVWGLGGPPALGLLMELAGPRGALVTGGLLIAGAIGAGSLLRQRRAVSPVVLRTEEHDVPGQPVLSPAA
ncbi:MFS transporter [Streptomyces hawaiiensis]|uniref:MFS transporter n=2 Tax=Streptomyces hawaiiensis TaxID=67305 RepID=A0A6G5R7U9_9ACTN|nr:MFS transporter [Streptomyces hawaiiensis]QCD53836.1 MFS transporter [Streptomyces hawaiiensis]